MWGVYDKAVRQVAKKIIKISIRSVIKSDYPDKFRILCYRNKTSDFFWGIKKLILSGMEAFFVLLFIRPNQVLKFWLDIQLILSWYSHKLLLSSLSFKNVQMYLIFSNTFASFVLLKRLMV